MFKENTQLKYSQINESYQRIPESIQQILGILTAVAVWPTQEKNQWFESGEFHWRKQLHQRFKLTFLNKNKSCFLENTKQAY